MFISSKKLPDREISSLPNGPAHLRSRASAQAAANRAEDVLLLMCVPVPEVYSMVAMPGPILSCDDTRLAADCI